MRLAADEPHESHGGDGEFRSSFFDGHEKKSRKCVFLVVAQTYSLNFQIPVLKFHRNHNHRISLFIFSFSLVFPCGMSTTTMTASNTTGSHKHKRKPSSKTGKRDNNNNSNESPRKKAKHETSKKGMDHNKKGQQGRTNHHDKHKNNNNKAKQTTKASGSNQQHREEKQARQSNRKHADVVTEAKVLWNELRQKNVSPTRRRTLMTQLMPLIQGKVKEICLQHDAARVVQAAFHHGTMEERQNLLQELTAQAGTLPELSKSQYAHFCVLKAIQYTHKDEQCSAKLVKNFLLAASNNNNNNNKNDTNKGKTASTLQLPKLAVHAVACKVVEALFTTLSPKKFFPLKLQLFGPHVALFISQEQELDDDNNNNKPTTTTNSTTLEHCLKQIPQHQEATLSFVQQLVLKGMEKNLYALSFFQDLLRDYCSVVSGTQVRSLLEQGGAAVCDSAVHLMSSRAGVRVLCDFISYGTAKDRKSICKSLKGYARSGLLHPQAYLAILRLVQLTDDTVLLHKNILNELLTTPPPSSPTATNPTIQNESKTNKDQDDKTAEDTNSVDNHPLLQLALSEHASKLFLFILLMQNEDGLLRKVLDPYEWAVLEPGKIPMVQIKNEESGDGSTTGKEIPTSKKDLALRQQELFQYLQQPLIDMCVQHAKELVLSRSGSAVLRFVYQQFRSPALAGAVVAAVFKDTDDDKMESDGILQHAIGHVAIKNLLLIDATLSISSEDKKSKRRETDTARKPLFAMALFDAMQSKKRGAVSPWTELVLSGNRGGFVVAAMLQVQSLRSTIDIDQAALKQQTTGTEHMAGIRAVLNQLQTKNSKSSS